MRQRVLIFSFALLIPLSFAFAQKLPPLAWEQFFGGNGIERGRALIQTFDGGLAIVGSTASINWGVDNTFTDIFLIKLDKEGNYQWHRTFGGTESDNVNNILQTPDSGFVLVGDTYSKDGDVTGNHGGLDAWIIRLDKDGSLLWQKCLGGSKRESFSKVVQDTKGNFIAIGSAESGNGDVIGHRGKADIWIVKINPFGNIVWKNCYGGTEVDGISYLGDTVHGSALVYCDEGITFASSTKSSNVDVESRENDTSQFDLWLVRLSDAGMIEWERTLGTNWHEIPHDIVRARDSGYAIAGEFFGPDSTGYILDHGMIVKTDASGALRWQQLYGDPLNEDGFYSIAETDIGFLAGGYGGTGAAFKIDDGWVCMIDDSGTVTDQRLIGSGKRDRILGVTPLSNGGFAFAGYSDKATIDLWVGAFAFPASVQTSSYSGFEAYPNPASDLVNIRYTLESNTSVRMELANVQGTIVYSNTSYHPAGIYEDRIPVSSLPAGPYLLRLSTGRNVYSSSVLVVK